MTWAETSTWMLDNWIGIGVFTVIAIAFAWKYISTIMKKKKPEPEKEEKYPETPFNKDLIFGTQTGDYLDTLKKERSRIDSDVEAGKIQYNGCMSAIKCSQEEAKSLHFHVKELMQRKEIYTKKINELEAKQNEKVQTDVQVHP